MKKSTRLFIVLILIETLLFAIGAWLINGLNNGTLHATNSPQETAQTIFTVLGGVMGGLAALIGMLIFSLRKKGL